MIISTHTEQTPHPTMELIGGKSPHGSFRNQSETFTQIGGYVFRKKPLVSDIVLYLYNLFLTALIPGTPSILKKTPEASIIPFKIKQIIGIMKNQFKNKLWMLDKIFEFKKIQLIPT